MKEITEIEQLDINDNSLPTLVRYANEISSLISKKDLNFDQIYNLIKINENLNSLLEKIINEVNERKMNIENIGLSEYAISLIDIYNSIFNEETAEMEAVESIEDSYSIKESGYDSVKIYLQEISKYPILPKEEQRELLVEYYNTRNKKTKDKLTEHNLRLVVNIAKKYIGRGISFLELIQEGSIGLMEAIDKFDPAKSYSLTTYAYWEIRQNIMRAIQNNSRNIRIPVHIQEKISDIRRKSSELESKLGREPTDYEIGKELNIPEKRVLEIKQYAENTISLDEKISSEKLDSDKEFKDVISDDKPSPEESAIMDDEIKMITALLDSLTQREKEVIEYRFGINGKEKKSLEKISIIFNCTRERIRQIEKRALKKMYSKSISKVNDKKKSENEKGKSIKEYLIDFHINEKELRKVLEQLEESDIELLNSYYNNEIISPTIINKNISRDTIVKIIEEKIKPILIEERLKNKNKRNNTTLELKLPQSSIPLSIFRFYQRYGYKKNKIERALKLLPKEEKELLDKIYIDNYQKIKNKNITAEEKELLRKILLDTIPNLVEKQNKNIYEYFAEEEYSNFKFKYAFLLLSEEEKKLIYKCFGIELDNPNDELLSDEKIKKRVYEEIFPKMKEILLNYSTERFVKLLDKSVYDFFKGYEYPKEEIDKLLDTLSDKTRFIINKYYNQSDEDKIKRNNQSYVTIINSLYKIEISIIGENRNKTKSKKEENMQKQKRHYNNINNIYEYFMNYGYTKEEINNLLNSLNEKQLEKLYLYYGKDLEHPIINDQIDSNDKKYIKNLVTGTLKQKIKHLKENSETVSTKKRASINNIYEYFEFHGYTKEEVNKVLDNLNDNQRELLILYYGKDLEHPIINDKISKNDKIRVRNLLCVNLMKKLEKGRNIEKKPDTKEHNNAKERQRISIKNLYEYCFAYGFTEDEIKEVLNSLTGNQKEILKTYYGEDYKSTKVIKKSNKEELQLRNLVTLTIKNKLKRIKQDKKVKKYSNTDNIYDYFKAYGYSEKEVDYVIKGLNNNQFIKLHDYYGKDLHNPVIKKDISIDEKKYIRNLLSITLKKRLENQREENNNLILAREKEEEIKQRITIKKIFLAFCMGDNLTEKDLSEVGKETLDYLINNNYLTLNNGIYEISSSKVELLLELYNGMLRDGQKEFASKILDKCYKIDPKNIEVNDYLLEDSIKNKKYEQTLKYLDLLIGNTEENEKHYYNLILLLISKVYELPKEYKEKVKLFNVNEIKSLEDNNDNNIRLLIYDNNILEALNTLKEQKNKKDIIEILLREIKIKEKSQEEEVKDNTNFQDIAISLSNNDLENGLLEIKRYLNQNNKNEYFDLALNLIRTSILEEDNNYTSPLMFLASIHKPNLNLLLAEIVQKFYKSLMDNDIELSEICLNIILNIDSLNEECLLKGNIEEIYKRKKVLRYELKNNRLLEFENILENVNLESSNYNDLTDNELIIIDDNNSNLIKAKEKLVKDHNIKVIFVGDKDKKLVVRKFNEKPSENEDELFLRAKEDYNNHDFSEALKKLLSLREDKYINNTDVYYMIGVCYVSLMDENNNLREKAKDYISISNELSKYNDFDFLKNIELDFLITLIKKKLDSFTETKETEIQEEIQKIKPQEEIEVKKQNKVQIDYNKFLGLILQNKNIDSELDELDISETEKQIIKLKLCKYLYKSEYYDQGDKLLKEVMDSSNKTGKVESIIKEITRRKKFYKYND